MKAWKLALIVLGLLINSGCAASKTIIKDNQNKVLDSYLDALSSGRQDAAEFIRKNLTLNEAFGYVKPYVPVIEPADVRLVWLPAHKSKYNPEVLVSGHWVYIMVKPSRWFIDAEEKDKAKVPLIIPYKEGTKK